MERFLVGWERAMYDMRRNRDCYKDTGSALEPRCQAGFGLCHRIDDICLNRSRASSWRIGLPIDIPPFTVAKGKK
jgi:hypothetical protein